MEGTIKGIPLERYEKIPIMPARLETRLAGSDSASEPLNLTGEIDFSHVIPHE